MTKVPINIRRTLKGDTKMMQAIAYSAYQPYVAEMERKPAPMIANFDAHIATDVCLVLSLAGKLLAMLLFCIEQMAIGWKILLSTPNIKKRG